MSTVLDADFDFEDFLEWRKTVPEPIRKTRPLEIQLAVYFHERRTGKWKGSKRGEA